MDLPKPPEDQELKNIIDKLAQFVARNGPEFEQMTKNKQKDNPKFGFLFGGEHFNYYQYKVTTEQAILKQKLKALEHQQVIVQHVITQQSIQSAPWQQQQQPPPQQQQSQQQLQEQIHQSERNLAAQHHVLMQQQQLQVEHAIRKVQDDKLQMLAQDCGIDLAEADRIMQPIIDSCTKDSISVKAGKGWIFNRAMSPTSAEVIARYLVKRISTLGTPFELRLHLVYLINDVLHHCLRKNADDLKRVLEVYVVPIFCTTSLGASDDEQQKLSKQLKSPATSLTAYKASLVNEYSATVSPIMTSVQAQYTALQKQHQEFVMHVTSQLQTAQAKSQQTPCGTPQSVAVTATVSAQVSQPISQQSSVETTSQNTKQQQQFSTAQSDATHSVSDSVGMNSTPGLAGSPAPASDMSSHNIQQAAANNINSTGGQNVGSYGQPMPGFLPHFSQHPPNFNQPPPCFPPSFPQPPPNYNQPANMAVPPFCPGLALPDLTKPPPGFPSQFTPVVNQPQIMDQQQSDANAIPNVPYFELPAGLMTVLVKLEDCEYKPLDPDEIKLPAPAPPSERLLAAVELFYAPPSHDRPRNSSEGWEQLGLYEFFKAKSQANKKKEEDIREGKRARSPRSKSRSRSRERQARQTWSPSPPRRHFREEGKSTLNYSRPKSKSPVQRTRSPSRSRSRSRSRSPQPFTRRSRSRSASPARDNRRRSVSRSPTPPSFFGGSYGTVPLDQRLDESNKGHQLLRKMGWGGAGLGSAEQGIQEPISGGEVRDRQDQYKGIGININDPFESFRKSKGQAFINRMKARAEEKMNQ